MSLILCVSQQQNDRPYRFSVTGIQVYTFEEVLYHVYHHWKQSVDDIASPSLAAWVNDVLGLSFLGTQIEDIARIESFSERMLAFLMLIEYFDQAELAAIRPHLERWEKRLEWEAYKERADDLMVGGEPGKAIPLYRRALQYDENVSVLNNLSVAYMQVKAYDEACRYLERARALDKDNWELVLHYGEALIFAGRFEEAKEVIQRLEVDAPKVMDADILYLKGELALGIGKPAGIKEAISCFEQTMAIFPREYYVFRLSDVYAKGRQFEKALKILERYIKDKDNNVPCLIKEAELYEKSGDLSGAIRAVKKAIALKSGRVELWVWLARYHRLDYNLPKAEEAIAKALSLDPLNERARMESARIQKNTGRTKAYQQLLKSILADLKGRYRAE